VVYFVIFRFNFDTFLPIMIPILNKVIPVPDTSFFFQVRECRQLVYPLHYHDDFQLNYIKEGKGLRMIGNQMQIYESGDLVLIGPGLPHFWTYDHDFYSNNGPGKSIVIQFSGEFAGEGFFDRPEMQQVKTMLGKASGGVYFGKPDSCKIIELIEQMEQAENTTRFIILINILHKLAGLANQQVITRFSQPAPNNPEQIDRINRVWEFIFRNYQNPVYLEEVANEIGMSPSAFSKFFKKHTNKTYISVIEELRIGSACNLLTKSDKPVSDIANECGFNNIANFNRQFKRITGKTPLKFRKQIV
jgi:AraC-like DNA-binding protein